MTLYTAPNLSSGIDDALVGTVTAVPSFIPMFLLFIFGVIFLGGAIAQQRKSGYADIPMWMTIASTGTLLTALPMTLINGLIQTETLAIVVAITILSFVWLSFSRGRNEI